MSPSEPTPTDNTITTALFEGESEMAALMRAYDWSTHPLGEPATWPESLKTSLRLLLHSSFPMFVWWSEGLYMFHNDAYLPALGKKHPQALGASARDMWSEIWEQIGEVVKGVVEEGTSFYARDLRLLLERKGFLEETYWTFSYSPAPGEGGSVGGVFCACTEVTSTVLGQRRLQIINDVAEATLLVPSLQEASQKISKVLSKDWEDIPFSLIYVLNEDGSKAELMGQSGQLPEGLTQAQVQLNELGTEDMWHLRQVMHSRKVYQLTQPAWPEQQPLANLKNKGGATAAVFPILKPGEDKLIGFFVSGISPWLEYDGEYQNFHQLLTGQIATSLASLQARAEAVRQQQELVDLFEQAPVAIAILRGSTFVVELANPGICEIWRKTYEEVINKPVFEAIPEVRGLGLEELLEDVYTNGVSHAFSEFSVTFLRQGQPQDAWLNFMYYPLRNAKGQITGVIVIAVEVTEQVGARQLIEIKNRELLAINADLDNFVYAASHDLKAPILNIEGLMNMLMPLAGTQGKTAVDSERVVKMIYSSIDRLKTTITDLSEVSRVQKEAYEDIQEVDVAEVVADVLSDLELIIRKTDAEISAYLQDCTLRFSPKNLRSIVYNLLSNALKYHAPERKPHIQLRCEKEDDFLVFSVTDNGLGIDLQHENKIFSMFKRMHTHVEGSGVGLYIVKRIVENAGGKITVESTVGHGSTFTIYLKK